MAGFGFDQIHILESLTPGNRTGRVLQTAILVDQPDAASRVHFHDVQNLSVFRAVLLAIADDLRIAGQVPFVHFECHGSEQGLQLSSEEQVTWEHLRDFLTPINIACRLNLFVSLAACHGADLATAIRLVDPAPVWGLLGPRAAEDAGPLLDFFLVFFTTLLKCNDLRTALNAAGGGLPSENRFMVLWPAEYFFLFVFKGYLSIQATGTEIALRAKRMAAQIQQDKGWPVEARRQIARDLRIGLRNHEHYFTKFLRTYLMLDRFPENEARFALDWARFQSLYEAS